MSRRMGRRVDCPRCQRQVAVSGWGVIRKHRPEKSTDRRCPGSDGRAPGWGWVDGWVEAS